MCDIMKDRFGLVLNISLGMGAKRQNGCRNEKVWRDAQAKNEHNETSNMYLNPTKRTSIND